jgi:hypothetical protein
MAELLAALLIMKSFLNYFLYICLTSVCGAFTALLGRMSAIQAPLSVAAL